MNTQIQPLTREQIESMPAGREMDALVATRLMGWRPSGGVPGCYSHDGNRQWSVESKHLPNYSTKLTAAWSVVEALASRYERVEVHRLSDGECVCQVEDGDEIDASYIAVSIATNVPLTICRAALLTTLENDA